MPKLDDGDKDIADPLQTDSTIFEIWGFGFTVTTTLNGLPEHVPFFGTTL